MKERRTEEFQAFQQGGKSFADPETIPGMAPSTEGEGGSPAKKLCPIHTSCLLHHVMRNAHGRTSSHFPSGVHLLEVNSCEKPCRACRIPDESLISLLNGQ